MDFTGHVATRDDRDLSDLPQQARGIQTEDTVAVTPGRHPLPSLLRPEFDVVSLTGEVITIPIPLVAYENVPLAPSLLRPELDVVSITGEVITIPIPPAAYEIPIAELDPNIGTYSLEERKERYLESLRVLHGIRVGIMDYTRDMYNRMRAARAEQERLLRQHAEAMEELRDLKLKIVESVVGSSRIPYRFIDLMRAGTRIDEDED